MDTTGEPFIWSTDAPDSTIDWNTIDTMAFFYAGDTELSIGTWTVWATPKDPRGIPASATVYIGSSEIEER